MDDLRAIWRRADYSRVPFQLYHDPEIYRLEQERIFRGPTWSVLGLEASELPDKGRGSVDQNIGQTLRRKTPDRTGGSPQVTGGDVGLRAMPGSADASDHGHRKRC